MTSLIHYSPLIRFAVSISVADTLPGVVTKRRGAKHRDVYSSDVIHYVFIRCSYKYRNLPGFPRLSVYINVNLVAPYTRDPL